MSWDEDGTPHPLALRRTGRSELEPDRLPEIRELEVLGWEPAPEDLRWVFLPYVWPPAARTWIPDRSTHWAVDTALDGHGHITGVECAPLPERDVRGLDREADEVLAALGSHPGPAAGSGCSARSAPSPRSGRSSPTSTRSPPAARRRTDRPPPSWT